ncbi:outer membrane assembly lipoprotein YfiO [Panacagrimonas perspica]|uniref:Outer membrane protein assembly factor BamD n=2 Tax=Panacagrimonas perspica TaxID=381431 RepID=A0A4S3K6X3_9GAMM|nr:outer membrane assembly lipoprotein YfiO [Panacagrimonas perspica]THD03933.1 hypothetical protein B1810_06605 [Panacagrimonas perspica]
MHIFSPDSSFLRMKISPIAALVLALLIAACSSNPDKKDRLPPDPDRPNVFRDKQDPLAKRREDRRLAQLDAEQLYTRARRNLDSSDFGGAIESYDLLSTRHPFSDYTTQGELERIYALYRNFDPDRALSSADRFLREHPRHPAVDYVHYVKGLTNFNRDESPLNLLPVDDSKSDVTSQRRAFDDFALLLQKYPGSQYAADAYSRMIFIRNRLATHELHVVDFYVRRGAYVAAAKRAEQIIGLYPSTPASYRALEVLVECYRLAGLEQQAKDAQRLLAAQDPKLVAALTHVSPADLEAAVAKAEAPPPAQKPGVMSRIAGFFSPLDGSKGPKEIIIPSSSKPAADPADAAAAGAATSESASTQAPGASAAEPAATTSNKIHVFYESPEDAPPPPPAPVPAEPAKDSAAAP